MGRISSFRSETGFKNMLVACCGHDIPMAALGFDSVAIDIQKIPDGGGKKVFLEMCGMNPALGGSFD